MINQARQSYLNMIKLLEESQSNAPVESSHTGLLSRNKPKTKDKKQGNVDSRKRVAGLMLDLIRVRTNDNK
ncbi:MAG: hypothetical protein CBC83_02315 [Flavobacteriales bacterium TMED123]|nr:hypothetical protein [Candidatus Neomarinimicrobiota bacterium]MAJ44516.1 hypothetical protein [Candidatus Neomarinimicrobiota bacterium]OUV73952.1 MAG: hypothetical protein CBC83_04760 [Flavobacteriales bacterium TMED123]OUV75593.1 MAG: hypothetical protein CBC83_02315 [Flavobacteriales bacterium TMED123]|tara:strand:- start:152 stop:364 length:213 start_codon:yes stop_codon:yes gene_type:complete